MYPFFASQKTEKVATSCGGSRPPKPAKRRKTDDSSEPAGTKTGGGECCDSKASLHTFWDEYVACRGCLGEFNWLPISSLYIYTFSLTESKVGGARGKRQAWTATVTDAFFEGLYQVSHQMLYI